MRVLKNVNSNRFFIATPALLKHHNIIDATAEESARFLAELNGSDAKISAKHARQMELDAPEDLDLTVDVSTFGKPELMGIATKIKLQYPKNVRVGQLRKIVQDALWKLREEQGVTDEAD